MKKGRALRTIRRLKAATVELSAWEGEFLEGVEARIGTYGRAFADPEKGARESAISMLQARKLNEIGAKTAGEPVQKSVRKQLVRRTPLRSRRPVS